MQINANRTRPQTSSRPAYWARTRLVRTATYNLNGLIRNFKFFGVRLTIIITSLLGLAANGTRQRSRDYSEPILTVRDDLFLQYIHLHTRLAWDLVTFTITGGTLGSVVLS